MGWDQAVGTGAEVLLAPARDGGSALAWRPRGDEQGARHGLPLEVCEPAARPAQPHHEQLVHLRRRHREEDVRDVGLFRAKYAAEQVLGRSSVRGTVIRPEAFADLWIELLRSTAGRSHRPLVFGRGRNPMGWVAVRDVAALTVRAVGDTALRGSTLTISGPERLTVTDLAQLVMAERGWPGVPRHAPTRVLRMAAKLPGRAGRQAEAALAMDVLPRVLDDARAAAPDLPCTSVQALLAQRAVHRA